MYLEELTQNFYVRNHTIALYEFLEIGLVTIEGGVKKFKEGQIKKRTGGRYKENKCMVYCGQICRRWMIRWFVVCQDGVLYTINSKQSKIREMLLIDSSFKYLYGRRETGSDRGIILLTPTRKLCLKAFSYFETIDWLYAIDEAIKASPYSENNRFMSFAPVRPPTAFCKFLIDGEMYFDEVCNALLKAEKEVFITDWWLSPEFHLKRPVGPTLNQEYRLDRVLEKIAKKGVKVCIILYKEVTIALSNDSRYTKRTLEDLHENIEVLLHPGYYIFMWSHHEKMVVVDQKIGFIGGLDLCYGRMDNNKHQLIDDHWHQDNSTSFWPKIDYYNVRIRDFVNVSDHMQELIDKSNTPRMPWHDVAVMMVGEPVKDMSRHFIQYWNFVKTDIEPKDKQYFLQPLQKTEKEEATVIHVGDNEMIVEEKKTIKEKISSFIDKLKPVELFKTKSQESKSALPTTKIQPKTATLKPSSSNPKGLQEDSDSTPAGGLTAPLLRHQKSAEPYAAALDESKDERFEAYLRNLKNRTVIEEDFSYQEDEEEEKGSRSMFQLHERSRILSSEIHSPEPEKKTERKAYPSTSPRVPKKIDLEAEMSKDTRNRIPSLGSEEEPEYFSRQKLEEIKEEATASPLKKYSRSTTANEFLPVTTASWQFSNESIIVSEIGVMRPCGQPTRAQ